MKEVVDLSIMVDKKDWISITTNVNYWSDIDVERKLNLRS